LTIGVHASLSAGNLRATIIDHHKRYPEVDLLLVDGSAGLTFNRPLVHRVN
jgi:hypothetical protein